MEHLGHVHIFGLLELGTQLEVAIRVLVAPVTVAIVAVHHSHQLKLEITTSVTELMDWTAFGLEKAARMIIHAAHFTTIHTSVYSFLQQPLIGLSYESALINHKGTRLCWCCLLKSTCSKNLALQH